MKKILLVLGALIVSASTLFADETETATRQPSSMWQTFIMIGIAIVFFYFILWRPEQKRRKNQEAQRNSLKKGDRVTAMGIIGTVVKIQETTIILRMVDGAKIEVLKAAISDVKPASDEEAAKEDAKSE
jgi:preprotein translocase subunit YajC